MRSIAHALTFGFGLAAATLGAALASFMTEGTIEMIFGSSAGATSAASLATFYSLSSFVLANIPLVFVGVTGIGFAASLTARLAHRLL
jgi:uncharacterized membrane-anchored protein YitT (DUF2179 family)